MPWTTPDVLRAYDPQVLGNTTRFTDDQLTEIISAAELEIEGILGRAFITRTVTAEKHLGDGSTVLRVKKRPIVAVTAATVDGTALTASQITDLVIDWDGGRVKHVSGWTWEKTCTITYTHGETATPPDDLLLALKLLCVARLQPNRNSLSNRATRYQPEGGGTWIMDSGGPNKTGVPEADTIIAKYWIDGMA